ncbi:hypothetical protein Fot_28257 [Forsythia ovata]|uniref:Uncharacterized protein n=1 Tax=Forsythia ovata TaxID=205694 RepID=A0ABD1TNI9_9LAMI
MGDPFQPTKPPDLGSSLLGLTSPVFSNPQSGHTPPQTGLLPPNSLQLAATLGLNPSDAAALSFSDPITGHPPLDAPPLGDPIGGSVASQQLAPALPPSDDPRKAMSAPSGSMAAPIPPPISGLPCSATPISSNLIAPRMAPALNQNGDSRPNLPAPQAPSGASNQQTIGGVPGLGNHLITPKKRTLVVVMLP